MDYTVPLPDSEEIFSPVGTGVSVPAAVGGVDGSRKVCEVECTMGTLPFLSAVANIPDEPNVAAFIYFRIKRNGQFMNRQPFNKFATSLGTPDRPGRFNERGAQGDRYELWAFNSDPDAAHPVTGMLGARLEPVR